MTKTLTLAAAAVLLAPTTALAEMTCAALGAHLATQPHVVQIVSSAGVATPFSAVTGTRCEANFIYSSRGGPAHGYAVGQNQRIVLRVGLPLNGMDNSGVSLWNGKVQN